MITRFSRHALLANTIDYAGTFPPAQLPVADCLKRAASFRSDSEHPWLMAKVILPLEDILSITPKTLYEYGADGALWRFAALASPAGLSQDIERMTEFNRTFADSCLPMKIVSYESKKFSESVDSTAELKNQVDAAATQFSQAQILPFFEFSFESGDWDRLSQIGKAFQSCASTVGLKVRTGGKRVPSVDELAQWVNVVAGCTLPFKATQGLHHPVSVKGEFGFINLLSAVNFAWAKKEEFGLEKIAECLSEQDPGAFQFEQEELVWKGFHLSSSEIANNRAKHHTCFGSCSLDEPDEWLTKIHL